MVRAPNLSMNFGGSLRCGGVAFLLPKIAEICIFCFAGVFFFFALVKMQKGGEFLINQVKRHKVTSRYDIVGDVLTHWRARGEKRWCQVAGDTCSVSLFHVARY